jgi:5-(carboxyamino)imidazole ribonucleotide mutase
VRVVSAHRTPDDMLAFGHGAAARGLRVLIAGAGGAAHLPGMLASVTTLPVIGVPVALSQMDGLDSLLSIVQMPKGVPVATMAVNGARNAGLLAVRILAVGDHALAAKMEAFQKEIASDARAQDADVSRGAKGSGGAAGDG